MACELDQTGAQFRDMAVAWWADQTEPQRGLLERGEPFQGFAPFAG